jgi:hypothetical protein
MQALESSNTLIIEFSNEIEKASWVKALVQATYRASVCLCLVYHRVHVTSRLFSNRHMLSAFLAFCRLLLR